MRLVKNPNLLLQETRVGDGPGFFLKAPVKGKGLGVYWIDERKDPEFYRCVSQLGPHPSEVPEPFRTWLTEMGVFLPEGLVSRKATFDREGLIVPLEPSPGELERAAQEFRETGFVLLKDLLPAPSLTAMRPYFSKLIEEGWFQKGEARLDRRSYAYHDPVACFFHRGLVPIVARLVGRTVYPYTDMVIHYEPGAVLFKHKDTAEDEISISLLLDYRPLARGLSPWPLKLQPSEGGETVSVFQAPGDAVLYRGAEMMHCRDALPAGHSSTSIIFSYSLHPIEGSEEQYAPLSSLI